MDDLTTWPDGIVAFIEEQLESFVLERYLFSRAKDEILIDLLDSLPILTYHATRLLPHEKVEIRTSGLQFLSKELVTKKIQEAVKFGYLTEEIGLELFYGSTLWSEPNAHRADQICLVLGKSPFESQASGLNPLFDIWGGESINITTAGTKYESLLKQIGEPAVVQALLPLKIESSILAAPSLTLSFIRAFKNEDSSSDIFWKNEPIPSKYILDIVRPEDMVKTK